MANFFVVTDIHGHYDTFMKLLRHWNPENEKLILLGDYVDRGPKSLQVLQEVKNRADVDDAHVNTGNHEKLFLSFLEEPEEESLFYYGLGGDKTIYSFVGDQLNCQSPHLKYIPSYLAKQILDNHYDLIEFVKKMPMYLETENWIFTHAGINLDIINWKNTSENDFLNIRHRFHHGKNETGKNIMFGHTSVQKLPGYNEGMQIWTNKDNNMFGIDGGAGSNKTMNAVKITNDEISHIITENC